VQLPEHTAVSLEILSTIARRHGLEATRIQALPDVGIINGIYRLGDGYALRIPRNHPAHVAQMLAESVAAPAALGVGVRTHRLVAFDDARDLLPVPYSIFEWVPGVSLESLELDAGSTRKVWRELGHDLAHLHTGVARAGPAGDMDAAEPFPDPRQLAEDRAAEGWFTSMETRWLTKWLDRIAPAALHPVNPCFLHLDAQAPNIIIQPGSTDYVALVDWGCAAWGDCAWDFAMPLQTVPAVLEGHREVAALDGDETAEARILWRRIQLILAVLPRGAAPGLSWSERPIAWLLDLARFFLGQPDGAWRDLRP
jgi:aminoglycoside phosphotransferase (APT) family kinase protein